MNPKHGFIKGLQYILIIVLLSIFREFKKGGSDRGLFVGKTPFNKEQLEFEVEIKEMTSKKLFAIGVCHSSYPVNQFLGWKQGSVGYHADNGR